MENVRVGGYNGKLAKPPSPTKPVREIRLEIEGVYLRHILAVSYLTET
jgi:hypothetical protein